MKAMMIVLVMLFSVLADSVMAQGSKPKTKSIEASKVSVSDVSTTVMQDVPASATLTGESRKKGPKMRAIKTKPGENRGRSVDKVEFIDETGNINKVLKRTEKGLRLLADSTGEHAGILEEASNQTKERGYEFRYYDKTGKVVWTEFLCCAGYIPGPDAKISEDGSIVVLENAPSRVCIDTSNDNFKEYAMPSSCVGMRVFNARGKLLFSAQEGGGGDFSKRAIYCNSGDKQGMASY